MTFRTRTLEFLPCPSKFLFFRYEPTFRTTSGLTSGLSYFRCSYDPWLIFLSFQFSRIFIFLYFSIFVFLRSVTDFNNEIYYYYIRTRKFLNARNQKSSLIIFRLYSEKFQNFHFWGKITKIIKWAASSRWSFHPNSAWDRIETMTIGKTHPSLWNHSGIGILRLLSL